METPIELPVLRAAFIKAEAWSVLDCAMPSQDVVMIGMKISAVLRISRYGWNGWNGRNGLLIE